METNGAKQKHGRNKKAKKNEVPHKEFVPHSRTKSYYGHRPQPSGSSRGETNQSVSQQQVYLSSQTTANNNQERTYLHVPKNVPMIKHENVPADFLQVEKDTLKVYPYVKHDDKQQDEKKQKEIQTETLKVEIPKLNAPKKTTESGNKKQNVDIAIQNNTYLSSASKTDTKKEPVTSAVKIVSNNAGNTQIVDHMTVNGNHKKAGKDNVDNGTHANPTKDKTESTKAEANVALRHKPKIQLRRCASVDVAELHRKKKGKKSSKKKPDKDLFLVVSKSGQARSDIQAQPQRSASVGKRPNSLKLLTDQSAAAGKNQYVFPTPTIQKQHSSISKEDKRTNINAVGPKIEVYDQSPNQFRSHSSAEERLKKVSVDFSSLEEIPPGEGYRRHGLKYNFPSSPYFRINSPQIPHVSIRIFGITIYSIVAFMVFCPMAAVLLVLVPLGILLKCSFKCCSCCCSRGQGQECVCCACGENLSLTEKFWIQNDQLNPKVVQSLIIVEYGLSAAQIINLINTRLVLASTELGGRLYPRLSQKVVRTCSEHVWVNDENFFIHDHVFTMPKGIESIVDLQEYVSDMASRPLSFNTALWEIQILTNFGEQQDSVLLLRMHPCLADGVSLVKILYKSIADVDSVTTVPPKFAQSSCLDSLKLLFYGPLLFISNFMCSRSDFNLLHGKHIHLSGKKLITWSEPFSLSAAIRIKQVTRSSLGEVLMSVAAGSIRSYLQLNGIPHPFDMHCSIPVYTGSNKPSVVGNHVILLKLAIPTNTEGIVPRLWQMKERMVKAKHSSYYSLTRSVFKYSYHVLPETLWSYMWQKITDKCSCVISCLPGPEIGLRLASKQIKTIFYWYPHVHSIPLTISFFTYGDHLQMAVSTDSAVLPNPDILTKDFIYQMECLSKLLASRRIPGEHASKKVDPALLNNEIKPEETVEEIQVKMSMIHQELQNLKHQLDAGKYRNDEHDLKIMKKIENLKEQFREYLVEMRKRKAAQTEMAMTLSEDDSTEDDDDFDIPRRPFRRRAMSVSSRLSTASISSTMRPLAATTPGATPAITPDFSPDSPLISDKQVPYTSYTREQAFRPYTVPRTHQRRSAREDFEILEYQYSPSVERRYKIRETY